MIDREYQAMMVTLAGFGHRLLGLISDVCLSKDMQTFRQNEDLLPVIMEHWTWRGSNYVAFSTWICVWLGSGIVTHFLVLNPGAIFHVTFPVVNRTRFDIFGSLWRVFNRSAMARIWYSVQASLGGTCVLVIVNDIPNSMPASSRTTTRDFMCFFLFWFIYLPLIWFPAHQIVLGVKARDIGPIVHQPASIHGSSLAWAMVMSLMTPAPVTQPHSSRNSPDFASRARTPGAALYPQFFAIPLTCSIVCLMGILFSSFSQATFGEAIWSPVDLLGSFLDDSPSHATKFGVWFISAPFTIAQVRGLLTNISANSVSAGCGLTASFTRFINIRRGGCIAALVGLCMCPWILLKSSNGFTSYPSAYFVFLSSIAGVMVTEYYVIRKGHYNVADLYATGGDTWYWYTYGLNLRAYAAYVTGILINVVGFAGATGRTVPLVATRIYELSFFIGSGVPSVVYYVLNRVFPVIGAADNFEEVDESGYEDKRSVHATE
ncbi:permease for cytosine/purines, uracil, thiamine, allantoin-domain-containing protein [Pisolithus microcarpus]|nr:permease for cytosine/purines, uracil, thiamine, allantoin-domain-containing protein [Pisolithus microcarpus]